MRKFLNQCLVILTVLLTYTGCKKSDPIEFPLKFIGIEIPELTDQTPGSHVTITGKGFASGDKLILKPLVAPIDGSGPLEATIINLNDSQLTFLFPENAKESRYRLVIQRPGIGEMAIGAMINNSLRGWLNDLVFRGIMKSLYPTIFDAQDSLIVAKAAEIVGDSNGELDVSEKGIKSLSGIGYFSKLKVIRSIGNDLGNLNLVGCESLERIYCGESNITSWVLDNPALLSIDAGHNPFTTLDVSKCPELNQLVIDNVPLEKLNAGPLQKLNMSESKFSFVADETKSRQLLINHKVYEEGNLLNIEGPVRAAGVLGVKVSTVNNDGTINIDRVNFGVISDVVIPQLVNYMIGNVMTVKGIGFLQGDNLVLKPSDGSEDIPVVISEVYDDKIQFLLPETVKKINYEFFLQRSGGLLVRIGIMKYSSKVWIPDASFRTALKGLYPEIFDSKDSLITQKAGEITGDSEGALDISSKGIKSLEGLGHFSKVKVIWCMGNNLGKLDLRGCTSLERLYCWTSNITSFVLDNPMLETLYAGDNPYSELDTRKCVNLKYLAIDHVFLRHLDLSTAKNIDFGSSTFLFVDDQQIARTLKINHSAFEVGNWINRPSSIKNAALINVKVSTFNNDGTINTENVNFN